jgi:hypothetical protein
MDMLVKCPCPGLPEWILRRSGSYGSLPQLCDHAPAAGYGAPAPAAGAAPATGYERPSTGCVWRSCPGSMECTTTDYHATVVRILWCPAPLRLCGPSDLATRKTTIDTIDYLASISTARFRWVSQQAQAASQEFYSEPALQAGDPL